MAAKGNPAGSCLPELPYSVRARGSHEHVPSMKHLFFSGLSAGKAGPVYLQATAVQAERGSW